VHHRRRCGTVVLLEQFLRIERLELFVGDHLGLVVTWSAARLTRPLESSLEPLQLTTAPCSLQCIIDTESRCGALKIALERAIFDFPRDALPMLLKCIVSLYERLEPKPQRGIANLLLAENLDPALEFFARDLGLELLDPGKVLLVERSGAVEALVEVAQELVEFGRIHVSRKKRSKHREARRAPRRHATTYLTT
jgi:hypothetical protein